MKRKLLNVTHWDFLDSYSYRCIHIDGLFNGYISLIKIEKVKQRITVDYEQSEEILLDDGYKGLIFLPDDANWCVSVIYNTSNEVVEWYFDITKVNSINEQGIPFYDDLYLDIVVSPDFKVLILDEDELKEALDSKEITQSDYEMAYNTCNKILKELIPNKDFLISFFRKYLVQFEH
jgi:predicted RNA-binding protein associated with RNAse of E/G family